LITASRSACEKLVGNNTAPGSTPHTRTFGPSSFASARVNTASAPFDTE